MANHSSEFDVIVAGHLCLDITPQFPSLGGSDFAHLFKPGKLIEVGNATISTGGAVSNTGMAIQKLGMNTVLMAKINNDPIGQIILSFLNQSGARKSISVVHAEQSSYTVVINPPHVDRIFLHCPGTNDTFTSEDIDISVCEKTRLFHFGYPTIMRQFYINEGAELVTLLKKVKATGATISVDMTLPDPLSDAGRANWDAILKKALPYVDIFVPSIEEAMVMLMPERYEQLCARASGSDIIEFVTGDDLSALSAKMISYGVAIAMIKAGLRGCYLKTANAERLAAMGKAKPSETAPWASRELWQPSYHAPEFASATGAGDAAIAGFLAALLRGKNPADCLKYASLLGWQNVQVFDAISGIKSWEETKKDFEAQLATTPIPQPGPEWNYDPNNQIWIGPGNRDAATRP